MTCDYINHLTKHAVIYLHLLQVTTHTKYIVCLCLYAHIYYTTPIVLESPDVLHTTFYYSLDLVVIAFYCTLNMVVLMNIKTMLYSLSHYNGFHLPFSYVGFNNILMTVLRLPLIFVFICYFPSVQFSLFLQNDTNFMCRFSFPFNNK